MAHRRDMPGWKTSRAQELRRNPTKAEAMLWAGLRGQELDGIKFRRQAPMAGYIVDFYAPKLKLVVEIYRAGDREKTDYEAHRNQVLESLGYRILRFSEHEVESDVDFVCNQILKKIEVFGD